MNKHGNPDTIMTLNAVEKTDCPLLRQTLITNYLRVPPNVAKDLVDKLDVDKATGACPQRQIK